MLFKRPINQERYALALQCCALSHDLKALSGGKGDETEIGEKGLNLSGGQKAIRVRVRFNLSGGQKAC